jgi:thioredoxin-like negative regulator of GroEL
VAVVVGGSLWWAWRSWKARRAMADVREEVEAGRHSTAAGKLIAFLAERPDSDEAAYLLGNSEMARGRDHAAAEAWARVPPGSPFAPRAIERRMELEVAGGRFAAAERLITEAMADPRIDGSALPLCLGPIYWIQGRIEDAEQGVERRWAVFNGRGEGATEKATDLIRLHIDLWRAPLPVELIRDRLETVGRLAPGDDRVWLGKANLAIRTGRYDEAERWLDACLRQRPDDVPVWRARLDLAVAANRVAQAREALKHLPLDGSRPAQIPRLAAWLAAKRGDMAMEQRALERLIAVDPTEFTALDRLAALAVERGQPAVAASLRDQKAEIERAQARYKRLYQRNQPRRDAAEMARLAALLGRRFEARAFKTSALAMRPDRDDLPPDPPTLDQRDKTIDEAGRTLAQALAADLTAPSASENRDDP